LIPDRSTYLIFIILTYSCKELGICLYSHKANWICKLGYSIGARTSECPSGGQEATMVGGVFFWSKWTYFWTVFFF
jgi:hypothetical protein